MQAEAASVPTDDSDFDLVNQLGMHIFICF